MTQLPVNTSLLFVGLLFLTTLAVWILRGLGYLGFLPGWVLWVLIILGIGLSLWVRRRRIHWW